MNKLLSIILSILLSSVVYAQTQDEYLWLKGIGDFYINFNNSYCQLEYSFDKVTWNEAVLTSADKFSTFTKIPANTKVYFKGINDEKNTYWGADWWGCIRTTTEAMYTSNSGNARFDGKDPNGNYIIAGGNMLSIVFGDDFMENRQSAVYSTLSRVLMGNGLLRDASNLYILPAEYGENDASFKSYGNQYGTFQWCFNMTVGPHVKYLSKDLFTECRNLSQIWYEGDGSETDVAWFDSNTSSEVEELVMYVPEGVVIKNKPAKAVVQTATSIHLVPFNKDKVKQVYNVNGQSLAQLQRGLNIIRSSDGSTCKVLVK